LENEIIDETDKAVDLQVEAREEQKIYRKEKTKQEFCYFKLDHEIPLIAAAIHNGHFLSEKLKRISALTSAQRLREEDPFTGRWTEISASRIIANFSRFEVDLNRPSEKCIYLQPEDAWGLNLWSTKPSAEIVAEILSKYDDFYKRIGSGIAHLLERYDRIVILDLHSYNHRRQGPDKPIDNPELCPEVNIGTGTMDRGYWGTVVDRFLKDLLNYKYFGRSLDVRENIKFKGGYFPRWIHDNFPQKACCLSVEFKKFFMDEWTGKAEEDQLKEIYLALKFTVPGILAEIKNMSPYRSNK
jgi:N-formylglutamate deformylase